MRKTSQVATKMRRGSSASDGKPGVSCMRAVEFAAPSVSKRHETSFTHKDSLPQQAFSFDGGGDEIFPTFPWRGKVDARSAAGWGDSVEVLSCWRHRRAPHPARLRRSTLPLQGRVKRHSPDGAERNPGLPRRVDAAPDFAPLHPGYARLRRCFPMCAGQRLPVA